MRLRSRFRYYYRYGRLSPSADAHTLQPVPLRLAHTYSMHTLMGARAHTHMHTHSHARRHDNACTRKPQPRRRSSSFLAAANYRPSLRDAAHHPTHRPPLPSSDSHVTPWRDGPLRGAQVFDAYGLPLIEARSRARARSIRGQTAGSQAGGSSCFTRAPSGLASPPLCGAPCPSCRCHPRIRHTRHSTHNQAHTHTVEPRPSSCSFGRF